MRNLYDETAPFIDNLGGRLGIELNDAEFRDDSGLIPAIDVFQPLLQEAGEFNVLHDFAPLPADGGVEPVEEERILECGCALCGGDALVINIDPATGAVIEALDDSASIQGEAADPVSAVEGVIGLLGQDQNAITVSFLDLGDVSLYAAFAAEADWTGEEDWSASEKAIVQQALDDISEFLDVTFVVVSDGSAADLQFLKNDNVASLGTAGTLNYGSYAEAAVRINHTINNRWAVGKDKGGQGYETLVHEIGHALGLGHTHDESFGSDFLRGMSSANAFSLGPDGINDPINSIMAYNDGWAAMNSSTLSYGNRANFGAWDVEALLNRYGAASSTNSGNTTYTLPEDASAGSYFETIIDTGGSNDTISASASSNDVVIDLRQATLDYTVETTGGPVSYVALSTPVGGFTISAGTVIENAVGGSGDDTLRANTATNDLTGGDGQDLFQGTAFELSGDTITDAEIGDSIEIIGLGSVDDVEFIEAGSNDILRISDGGSTYDVTVQGLGAASAYDIDVFNTGDGVLVVFDTPEAGAVGNVEGVVFEDSDQDGVRDAGESGFEDWTVFVDANGNGVFDSGETSTTTAADGSYIFNDLDAGSVDIGVIPQAGYIYTSGGGFAEALPDLPEMTITGHAVTLYALGIPGDEVVEFDDEGDIKAQLAEAGDLVDLDEFRADPQFSGIDGTGYTIVVLDTGIDMDHPFFGPDSDGDGIADRIVYTADFTGSASGADDVNGHGTHVSSVSVSSDGTDTGAAPGANIIHLKVLGDNGSGNGASLEAALQWVAANVANYNIVAVNLSLGFGDNSSTADANFLNDEFAALRALGVINIAAAGNDYFGYQTEGAAYPASDPDTIGVGAVFDAVGGGVSFSSGATSFSRGPDEIASFSQRSPTLTEIFAPGGAITAAATGGGTTTFYGTSQASPLVAGVVALVQQLANQVLGRSLTFDEFESLIQSTGVTIYDGDDEDDNVTNTETSYQRLDVHALAEAIAEMGVEPVIQTVTVVGGETATADFGFVDENANFAPVAEDDAFGTDEDTVLSGADLLVDNGSGADSDANSDTLTVTEVNGSGANVGAQITLSSGALVTVQSNGSVSYDPNGQFETLGVGETDTDSFTYTVSDGNGGTDTATATITIDGVNDDPVGGDDTLTVNEDTFQVFFDVVTNDTDIDGDNLTVLSIDQSSTNGIVANLGNGEIRYRLNSQFENLNDGEEATDSFTYTVSDGNGGTDVVTVTITITGIDDNPGENYSGTPDPEAYTGGKFADLIDGAGGNDTLNGGLHDDTIFGGAGDDFINGQTHDDEVSGQAGADTLIGGAGFDLLDGGTEDDLLNGNDDADTLRGGEGIDSIFGGRGNDSIFGDAGDDQLNGNDGEDTLLGGEGRDRMNGQGGNDSVDGEVGDDFVYGGPGDDMLFGSAGNDVLGGNDGNDTIDGGDDDDAIFAGSGEDVVDGGAGNDRAFGGEDNDSLTGGTGEDELSGENGNDTINGDADDDRCTGGDGDDLIFGGTGNDVLFGQGNNDTLHGGDNNDFMQGGAGDDELNGDDGIDQLFGGAGNDTLTGGEGNDFLTGGDDDDLFVFSGTTGTDRITDFTAGAGTEDVIRLEGYGTSLDEFAEVLANASDDGTNTTIDLGGGNFIVIEGTVVADLHEDDFMFA